LVWNSVVVAAVILRVELLTPFGLVDWIVSELVLS